MKESESEVAQLCPILCDLMESIAHQAPLSMGFSRQEYWSRLPFSSPEDPEDPEDLPNPGIKPASPALQTDYHLSQQARLSPCLFNLYAECIMQNAMLDELQAGINVSVGNINNLRYSDDIT